MLYLLDANVLIRAHEDYYPIERVPQFWIWLQERASANEIKMAFEIHDEIACSNGPLSDWISEASVKESLLLEEEPDGILVDRVIQQYAADLDDSEIEKVGRDPFLIAYGLVSPERMIVTKEVSKPAKQRANRKIPDVCKDLGVKCINDFEMYKILNFRT